MFSTATCPDFIYLPSSCSQPTRFLPAFELYFHFLCVLDTVSRRGYITQGDELPKQFCPCRSFMYSIWEYSHQNTYSNRKYTMANWATKSNSMQQFCHKLYLYEVYNVQFLLTEMEMCKLNNVYTQVIVKSGVIRCDTQVIKPNVLNQLIFQFRMTDRSAVKI